MSVLVDNPKAWLQRFHAAVTAPSAYFPVFDASHWTLNQPGTSGIGYWLRPRENRTPRPQSWFTKTMTFLNQPTLPWLTSELYLAVYWPRFLATAQSNQVSPVKPLAIQLWFVLRKHIAVYDQMLADELEVWARNYQTNVEARMNRPMYFGESSPADLIRFDAHTAQLLRDDGFNRYIASVMAKFLDRAASPAALYALPTCRNVGCANSRKRFCETCKPGKALRWHGVALLLRNFDTNSPGWVMPEPKQSRLASSSGLVREVAYLAAGLVPEDGVVLDATRKQPLLVVSMHTVLQRLMATRRKSLFTDFIDGVYPEALYEAGYLARQFMDAKLDVYAPVDRPTPRELAAKYGFPFTNEITHSIGIYNYKALRAWLTREGALDRRFRNQLLARARSKRSTIKPERVSALIDYRDASGTMRQLKVIPHAKRYYFQPPFPVTEGNYPREYARKFKGQFFFTPRGADAVLSREVNTWASHWCQWLYDYRVFSRFDFRRLRYDNQYSERLTAISTGEQKRLGRFSTQEFQVLDGFLRLRPPKTGLSEAEWAEISQALPTRSKASIRNAIEKLGKDYAVKNGWAAYVNSPYCLQISSARRRRWAKDGVET